MKTFVTLMLCGAEEDKYRASQHSKLLNKDAESALHVDHASRLKEIEVVLALVQTECMDGVGRNEVLGSGICIISRDPQVGRKPEFMQQHSQCRGATRESVESELRMGIAYRLYRYGYRYRFYRLYRYNRFVILEIAI